MIRYVFKDDALPIKNASRADAQRIGEALAELAQDAGGNLRTEAALEAARNPAHPLHPHIEWDDLLAAERYRLDQVRTVIRCIRVVDEEVDKPVHAFLSIAERGGTSYRTVQDVQSSAQLRAMVLKAAERDLEAWERRYQDVTDACKLVRSARGKVKKRRERLETRTAA